MADNTTSEDVCEIPVAVRRFVIPRRGGSVGGPLVFGADAAERYSALLEGALPDLETWPEEREMADYVDAWVARRGLGFAVDRVFEVVGAGTTKGSAAGFELAARLRHHLAFASEADYASGRETIAGHRKQAELHGGVAPSRAGALAAFLLPDRVEWVDADVAAYWGDHRDYLLVWFLCGALTTTQQAEQFGKVALWWVIDKDARTLWTMFDGAGAGLLPALKYWLQNYMEGESVQRTLGAIACMPTDDTFRFLVENVEKKYYTAAVLAAAQRFPRRAVRLLTDAARADTPRGYAAMALLRMHTLANEELVRAELGGLGAASRDLVERILAGTERVPDAEPDTLPDILVSPPWLSRTPQKPVVVAGLTAPEECTMVWRAGEEEEWAAHRVVEHEWRRERTLEEVIASVPKGEMYWFEANRLVVSAPEEVVRPVLAVWEPDVWRSEEWSRRLVTRFGTDALPVVLRLARKQPANCAFLLMPFGCSEVAVQAADWLARLKSARPAALAWLNRHPGVAARTLVPTALGKAGKARTAAELALRTLVTHGHRTVVDEAAAGYGEAAAAAIATLVEGYAFTGLPKVMPEIPAWADPAVLPQIRLRGQAVGLSPEVTRHVLQMLAISKPGSCYAGVQRVKEICDPATLSAFAWALFQYWRAAEYPTKEDWAFDVLRWWGDDETVRRLAPMIRQWPGENGHLRAVAGLGVLTDIGGDTALIHLYGISQKVKFKGLKERAAALITETAENLGLTAEQLGDRLVPDLGLDGDGGLTLDYGARRFRVGFDEQLKPFVSDRSGKRLKALPKPGAQDDPELAPAAYQRFSGLKKDVRTLAADQITRLELAMVAQRRWTPQEFQDYFVAHPLLRHIVRRLVWAVFEGGKVTAAFRVAEDLSLADAADQEYRIPEGVTVGIAHPLHLGDDVAAWSEMFADYEILQPFAQLGRQVFALGDEEGASLDLTRFCGIEMPIGKVLGLERRGWQRGTPMDAGIQGWVWRLLPNGRAVTADLEPGIAIGYVTEFGEVQKFERVYLALGAEVGWPRRDPEGVFSSLDAVTASEILRDLTEVTAS